MIHVIGDSHSHSFDRILGVSIHHIGPITLKRVGYEEDNLLLDKIKEIGLKLNDTLIFCFGEIDIRCYVKPNLIRKLIELEILLTDWVECYLTHICKLPGLENIKIYIMSVVPPAKFDNANLNPQYPVAGTDEERSNYVKKINEIIFNECNKRKFGFLNIYSKYIDGYGMLRQEDSDGHVHIANTKFVKELLIEKGMLK